jgi:hypothetical protein
MMPTTGRPNPNDTIAAWADVVVKMWRDRITEIPVMDTQSLYNSFVMHVTRQAGGDLSKIEWMFNQYGIYQNYGKGSGGDNAKRERKRWFSTTFFREVMKLKEYLQFWYSENSKLIVLESFGSTGTQNTITGSPASQLNQQRNNAGFRQKYKDFGFSKWKHSKK